MVYGEVTTSKKALERGSAHYGPCERCGKHMTEAFRFVRQQEVRVEGMDPFVIELGDTFAHDECPA